MIHKKIYLIVAAILIVATQFSFSQESEVPTIVLFKNVNIFDGNNEQLIENSDVLIENNLIKKIGANLDTPVDATVIDSKGKWMIPGLHEQHIHFSIYNPLNLGERLNMTEAHMGAVAIIRAERMLMNGYTTVRDMGGPAKFVQQIVDAGLSPGPRVFPSEAFSNISSPISRY